jgi:hypothetical protein
MEYAAEVVEPEIVGLVALQVWWRQNRLLYVCLCVVEGIT